MTRPSGPSVVVGRQHRRHASTGRSPRRPPAAGCSRLVGAEQPEVAAAVGAGRARVEVAHAARRAAGCSRAGPTPGLRDLERVVLRGRGSRQRPRSSRPPLAYGRRRHPLVALAGRAPRSSGDQPAVGVEQLLGSVRPQPLPRACAGAPGCSATPDSGTWWARLCPRPGRRRPRAGPVQPFGVRSTIAGQRVPDRSLGPSPARASAWIARIALVAPPERGVSSAGNTCRGSSPATTTGSQPWLRR